MWYIDRCQPRTGTPGGGDVPVVDDMYDEHKFRELLVLVAARLTNDKAGGATKLNKVLYFADFAHVRRTGRSITGAAYRKLANGPAPRTLIPVREELMKRGDAELVEQDFLGYKQNRLIPRRPADESVFDAHELRTIEDVLSDLDGMNAREVSDLSRKERGGASQSTAKPSRTPLH